MMTHMDAEEPYEDFDAYDRQKDFEMHQAERIINGADAAANIHAIVDELRMQAPLHAKNEKDALETVISMARSEHGKRLAQDARVRYQQIQQSEEKERFSKYVCDDR